MYIFTIVLAAAVLYAFVNYMSALYYEKDKLTIKKCFFYSKTCFVISLVGAAAFAASALLQYERIDLYNMIKLYLIVLFMGFFTVTDLKDRIIPNKFLAILLLLWLAVTSFYVITDFTPTIQRLGVSLLGLIFCSLTFGLTYLISRRRIGGGDVKLALLMGLYLESERVVGAVIYGSVLIMLFSLVGLITKKIDKKTELPFCPFLYIGTLISLFLFV